MNSPTSLESYAFYPISRNIFYLANSGYSLANAPMRCIFLLFGGSLKWGWMAIVDGMNS